MASDACNVHDSQSELGALIIQEGHEAPLNVIERREASELLVRAGENG